MIIESTWYGYLPRSYDYFGKQLFIDALDSAKAYQSKGTLAKPFQWNFDSFEYVLKVVSIVAGLAVPAFIVGGISCLGVGSTSNKLGVASAANKKETLKKQKETWIMQKGALEKLHLFEYCAFGGCIGLLEILDSLSELHAETR